MAVIVDGERQLSLTLESFPPLLREKLKARITALIERLKGRVQDAAPFRTGELRSEVTSRVFSDQPDRVAGYVQIYAPGKPGEYAKAATLEYGTDKVRRAADRTSGLRERVGRSQSAIAKRVGGKPAHIQAYRYLRGPIEAMRGEVDAELSAAINESVQEAGG